MVDRVIAGALAGKALAETAAPGKGRNMRMRMVARVIAGALAGMMLAGTAAPSALAQDATPAPAAADCAPATAEESGALAESLVLAWNTLDDAGLDTLFAPDADVETASSGDFSGAAGFETFRQDLHDGFPDVFHTVHEVVAEGDTAYARWTATGTNTGEWRGTPATGEKRAWSGITRIVAECGRVVDSLDQVDQLALDGLAPADSAAWAPAGTPEACTAATGEEIRAAAERLWAEGWNTGDVAVYRELVAADVVHHWTSGADTVGEDASAERLAAFFANVPDLKIEWDHLVVDGDLAAAGWRLTGTAEGELLGVPGNGAAIDYTGFNVYRFACGEIVEVWSEGDIPTLQAQLAAAG